MATLTFSPSTISPLLKAARNGESLIADFGFDEPGLLLASNRAGVYLLANVQTPETFEGSALIAHAHGMDPENDEHWDQARHESMGGEDLVEFIPARAFEEALADGAETIVVSLTDEEIMVYSRAIE